MSQIVINVTATELTVSGTQMDFFTAMGMLERAKDSVKATGFDSIIVTESAEAQSQLEASLAELEVPQPKSVETYVNPNVQPEVA